MTKVHGSKIYIQQHELISFGDRKSFNNQISFVEWPLNYWSHYDCLQIYLRAFKYDSFDTVILRGHKRYKGKVQGAKHRSEKANH